MLYVRIALEVDNNLWNCKQSI